MVTLIKLEFIWIKKKNNVVSHDEQRSILRRLGGQQITDQVCLKLNFKSDFFLTINYYWGKKNCSICCDLISSRFLYTSKMVLDWVSARNLNGQCLSGILCNNIVIWINSNFSVKQNTFVSLTIKIYFVKVKLRLLDCYIIKMYIYNSFPFKITSDL